MNQSDSSYLDLQSTMSAISEASHISAEADKKQEQVNMSVIFDKYKDLVAKLPKENGWKTQHLYQYQGFWFPSMQKISVETVMALQHSFQPHPTDIYIATMPKSGTTWLKALVFAVVNRNKYKINDPCSTHPLLTSNPHHCLPFIDGEIYKPTPTYEINSHSPRLFSTHIPYSLLPQSILDSGCRLVYLCRDAKDVLVSLFHYTNKIREKERGAMTLEEAFDLFCKGVIPSGPYWEHVVEYRKASLERPGKVLFLTYEGLKGDIVSNLKRLAEFLGFPFTKEEEDEGVVEGVVRLCSFENLSEVNKEGMFVKGIPNAAFFRGGKVGDWTNYLTDKMSRALDEITKEKFDGLDIASSRIR